MLFHITQIHTPENCPKEVGGSKGGYLFRNVDDPNELVILLEAEDLEKVRQFIQSEELRQAMKRGGVSDQPDVYFLDEIERVPE